MSLPKHESVKNCPECKAQRQPWWTQHHALNVVEITCYFCDHRWQERVTDGSAPVEEESKSVRVAYVGTERQENIVCHSVQFGDDKQSFIGRHAAQRLEMMPGQSGELTLTWTPDPEPKLEPEPVFAVQREETKLWWECSRCRVTLPRPARISIGTVCPKCARTFNADPKHLDC